MYITLEPFSPIIGVDFSYSDAEQRMLSLYFSNWRSMVVEPKFVNVLTMLNGMFTLQQVSDYMSMSLGYSDAKCKRIIDEFREWPNFTSQDLMTNWGNCISTFFSFDRFKSYDLIFNDFHPEQIDLLVLLSKFGFRKIVISQDFCVTKEIVDNTMLLDFACLGKTVCAALLESENVELLVDESIEHSPGTISVVADNEVCLSDATQYMTNNYSYDMRLCSCSLFDKAALDNILVKSFMKNLNIASDVIFGIANGVCE